jgi:hypothetical protein
MFFNSLDVRAHYLPDLMYDGLKGFALLGIGAFIFYADEEGAALYLSTALLANGLLEITNAVHDMYVMNVDEKDVYKSDANKFLELHAPITKGL